MTWERQLRQGQCYMDSAGLAGCDDRFDTRPWLASPRQNSLHVALQKFHSLFPGIGGCLGIVRTAVAAEEAVASARIDITLKSFAQLPQKAGKLVYVLRSNMLVQPSIE